jgi:uncharacterized membrane protein YiaA
VFILAIFNLAHQLHIDFLQYAAVVLSLLLVGLWALVMKKTLAGAYSGQLFSLLFGRLTAEDAIISRCALAHLFCVSILI